MGVWDELVFACNLKEDVPQQVIDILNYMMNSVFYDKTGEFKSIPLPEHPFFKSDEWKYILVEDTVYFPGETFSLFTLDKYDPFYKFTIRAKAHCGSDTIASFLDWLFPYSETHGFMGYTRCDEIPEFIDLIFFEEDGVYYDTVKQSENETRITRSKITK